MIPSTPRVFLVCSGLGHVYRGYETFTRQCFDALKNEPRVRVQLFKGAGPSDVLETTLPGLRRTRLISRLAGKAVLSNGYVVEQLNFALSLIPFLRRQQPDVVFFSDIEFGMFLSRWRKWSKAKFKLLFSNGSPAPPPFPLWDHIHQVSPEHYQRALQAGVDSQNQSLIPYGYQVPEAGAVLGINEKKSIRERLGLPTNRPIVISVGMISATHKRMDYVIREIAGMPAPRPFLLLLGQFVGAQTQGILQLAGRLLGADGCYVASVHPDAMREYYQCADLFVLASLTEGFGRVFLEALSVGLPCIAHDHVTARYVLGPGGVFGDLRRPGTLAALIGRVLTHDNDLSVRLARNRDVRDRFSWDRLTHQYVDMLCRVALGQKEQDGHRMVVHERTAVGSAAEGIA